MEKKLSKQQKYGALDILKQIKKALYMAGNMAESLDKGNLGIFDILPRHVLADTRVLHETINRALIKQKKLEDWFTYKETKD